MFSPCSADGVPHIRYDGAAKLQSGDEKILRKLIDLGAHVLKLNCALLKSKPQDVAEHRGEILRKGVYDIGNPRTEDVVFDRYDGPVHEICCAFLDTLQCLPRRAVQTLESLPPRIDRWRELFLDIVRKVLKKLSDF